MGRRDDKINKNVSHKIRKPKPSKKKKITSVRPNIRGRVVKMPSRLAVNRSPVKPGKKKKLHRLSSPGISLLENESIDESDDHNHSSDSPKFFTSRSREAAYVNISKTIKLKAQNGEMTIAQRKINLEKKNIGRKIENELDLVPTLPILKENLLSNLSTNLQTKPVAKPTRFIIESPRRKANSSPLRRTNSPRTKSSSITPLREKVSSLSLAQPLNDRRLSPRKHQSTFSPRKGARNDEAGLRMPVKEANLEIKVNSPKVSSTTPKKSPFKLLNDVADSPKRKNITYSPVRSSPRVSRTTPVNSPFKLLNDGACSPNCNNITDSPVRSSSVPRTTPLNSPFKNLNSIMDSPKLNRIIASPVRRSPRKLHKNFTENKENSPSTRKRKLSTSGDNVIAQFGEYTNEQDVILSELLADNEFNCDIDTNLVASPRKSPRKERNVKYFPIFDPSRRLSGDLEKSVSKGKATRYIARYSDPNQMIIDAGQKYFGAVYCKTCSFLYEVGDPDEEKMHDKHHERFERGLSFPGWKQERVVSNVYKNGGRVLKIVSKDSGLWWRKMEDVLQIIDNSLGIPTNESFSPVREHSTIFIYVKLRRVCGCLVSEEITQAYKFIQKVTANEGRLLCCSGTPQKAYIGINRIWVSAEDRRMGIASLLVDAMRSSVYPCHYLKVDEFAFSDPTEQGMEFAQKYTGREDFLVYRRE